MVYDNKTVQNDTGRLTEDESCIIGVLQMFSMLSVIAAHVNALNDASWLRGAITAFWNAFGCVGVVVFLVLVVYQAPEYFQEYYQYQYLF